MLITLCFVLFSVLKYAVGNEDSEDCMKSCPSGEEDKKEEMGNHCYYWSTTRRDWRGAEFFCKDKGGHLAAVTSLEIHNFLMKRVDKDDKYTWFWIGGSDKESEGTWKWVDGSPWNFTNWASASVQQPSNVASTHDCLQIYHNPTATNGWNDQKCGNYHHFICSWKLCPAPPPPRDPCNPSPCGPNADASVRGTSCQCTCRPEYFGDPYTGCRPECVVNSDCDRTLACGRNNKCYNPCPGTCGFNAVCKVINHNPTCTCLPNYIGDPFTGCSLEHDASTVIDHTTDASHNNDEENSTSPDDASTVIDITTDDTNNNDEDNSTSPGIPISPKIGTLIGFGVLLVGVMLGFCQGFPKNEN